MFYTDYHCHLLPGMDDGAKTPAMAAEMLSQLEQQNVSRVFGTPHYFHHRESVASFLARRQEAARLLQEAAPQSPVRLSLGAEVALERDISTDDDLPKLALDGSQYILIEMPYTDYRPWMGEEIHNIAARFQVTPVIAHIERCLDWYTSDQMQELLAVPGTIRQVNCDSLSSRSRLKFILSLIKEGSPVLFGTDSHNLDRRAPSADWLPRVLMKKLPPAQFDQWLRESNGLIP